MQLNPAEQNLAQPTQPETPTSNDNGALKKNSLSACIESLGINQIQRHIFLCADQTKPKC
jgi:hypothetical protein